ncbi:hypothetical protein ACSDBR_11800 [Acidithiobacillus ferriphilus]|uniref:hypothetical protein n=1 Tax=Acidithiobacillus ferriphilus TaxID=1689834 RepID=UPI002315ACD0|nr:hypothetical protein [Acidithiobacillus sp.]
MFDSFELMNFPEFFALKYYMRLPASWITPSLHTSINVSYDIPSLSNPISQACTFSQFGEPICWRIADALGVLPVRYAKRSYMWVFSSTEAQNYLASLDVFLPLHRWHWERFFIFRVSEEFVNPSVFIDFPAVDQLVDALDSSGCSVNKFTCGDFYALAPSDLIVIRITPVIGSFEAVEEIVGRLVEYVNPGGALVLMLDVNIYANEAIFKPDFSVLGRSEIERLALFMISCGLSCVLNFHTGDNILDYAFDNAPYGLPHLRAYMNGCVVGSYALYGRRSL